MTSGSAINKIKSKRKDLIKEYDIKSSIKSGGKTPIFNHVGFSETEALHSTEQLLQYVLKWHFTRSRHVQNPFGYAFEW